MTQPAQTEYIPDYEIECINCGQTPTVNIFQNGLIQSQTELCGPCCFGEADALDPDNW